MSHRRSVMLHCNIATAALLLATLTSGGCLESRHGTLGGDVSPTGDTLPADTQAADTHVSCEAPGVTFASAVRVEPYSPWHLAASSGSHIDFSSEQWAFDSQPGLFRLDVATGKIAPLPGTEPSDVLVAAGGGATLLLRGGAGGATPRLVYRDDAREVPLSDAAGGERAWGDFELSAHSRVVSAGRAAWRSCDDDGQSRCVRSRLRAWSGGAVTTLWEEAAASPTAGPPPLPEVSDTDVLWAEPASDDQGTWRIRSWAGGTTDTLQRVATARIDRVVRLGADVVWFGGDGIWRARGDGTPSHVSGMVCGAVDSDGAHAVMLCDTGDGGGPAVGDPVWSPFPHGAGELWLYGADGRLTHVPTDGAVRVVPRVDGALIAWLTYQDADAGCYPSDGTGSVMVAPVAAPELSVAVAAIGIGCYCCGAIWPELRLTLRDGLLAWKFAADDRVAAPEARGGSLAWIRADANCR